MSSPNDRFETRAPSRTGEVLLGKWQLDRLLGVGGTGSVYAATHRNGKAAAIKILHPELSVHANLRARFLREGYAANKVGHAGAVSVLDDDMTEDGAVFLVMEMLEGETVAARARRLGGCLDAPEVLSIADQVLDVLVAAHDQGIVHRDLKPENLFLTLDGVIKVLDFGIARLTESRSSSTVTNRGSLMGTPAYMAPEQARGLWDEVDRRTDLWAVGATMYTLLCGKPVHVARTANEQLLAAMTNPALSIADSIADLPEPVSDVIDRALAFYKNSRWPDARTMQSEVRRAYDALLGSPMPSTTRLATPPTAFETTLPSDPVVLPMDDPPPAEPARALHRWIRTAPATTMVLSACVLSAAAAITGLIALTARGVAKVPADLGAPQAASEVALDPPSSATRAKGSEPVRFKNAEELPPVGFRSADELPPAIEEAPAPPRPGVVPSVERPTPTTPKPLQPASTIAKPVTSARAPIDPPAPPEPVDPMDRRR